MLAKDMKERMDWVGLKQYVPEKKKECRNEIEGKDK